MTRSFRFLRGGFAALLLGIALLVSPEVATASGEQDQAAGDGRAEIAFGRWLDLRIGMTSRDAIATGKVARRQGPCRTTNLVAPWDERGYLFFEQGRLRWLTLYTARERTGEGVGVGSTLGQLRRAHPRISEVRAARAFGSRLPYVTVSRGDRTITYQFDTDARVTPRTRVRVVNLSGRSPRVLRVAC